MAAVKSKDTAPELVVRAVIHRLGYRYRLHRRDLPGTPDIVLPRLRKIINVHGCFWHMHTCRHGRLDPVKNAQYWKHKRQRNAERDRDNLTELRRLGWAVLIVWECRTKNSAALERKILDFLSRRTERF